MLLNSAVQCISDKNFNRYYIVYVFQGAGITGRRGNLISAYVMSLLNLRVALTPML